jgi:hypothetical protein
MLSQTQTRSLKKQLIQPLHHLFPKYEPETIDFLADHMVGSLRNVGIINGGFLPSDDVPDSDLHANPLDGDMPDEDDGTWLDHSPELPPGPTVDGDPLPR